uniref:Cytochrome c oxidase subunit 3 n=1 Tax=Galathealinum brachiosum TaxID=53701 RepID=A0A0E3DQY6_9ANNE|nr:cytochrome c oxidase subunit III [Galathealinum brachiosum]AIL54812.1 cytochrome c oxidase subunit III [Galathealinum brachiosum]
MIRQPYHIVEFSPWPFFTSMGLLGMTCGGAAWLHFHSPLCLFLGLSLTSLISLLWWRDVIREATLQGYHNYYVSINLRWGMILFILSEVLFFAGFFWGFFHSSLAPNIELGCTWPPMGITPINPFSIPLLNTTILLSSGVTVTWAHHSLLMNKKKDGIQALILTVMLGMYFTFIQINEYMETTFTIADSAYGTTFFICTGFHGLHVLVGTLFLLVCLLRLINNHFSTFHHFGFEAAAWYWHFVDVVWICLYLLIYWWGS